MHHVSYKYNRRPIRAPRVLQVQQATRTCTMCPTSTLNNAHVQLVTTSIPNHTQVSCQQPARAARDLHSYQAPIRVLQAHHVTHMCTTCLYSIPSDRTPRVLQARVSRLVCLYDTWCTYGSTVCLHETWCTCRSLDMLV